MLLVGKHWGRLYTKPHILVTRCENEDRDGGVQFMMCCPSPVLILRSAYASVSEKEHNTGKKTSVLSTGSSFTCPTKPLYDILPLLI